MSASKWQSETESPKAWMSVRDADLYEGLLHILSTKKAGESLRVLEWGGGRSSLYYTGFLDLLGIRYSWLLLEHYREYFEKEVKSKLIQRPGTAVLYSENVDLENVGELIKNNNIAAVVFNHENLQPFREGHEHDRYANLDDYIKFPAKIGFEWDLIVIDGRKRRRCIVEASQLLARNGYVILHDAFREYYQCSWNLFISGQRFGDEWWIGSHLETNFLDVLPEYAFSLDEATTKN